jgi:hypothetical protein
MLMQAAQASTTPQAPSSQGLLPPPQAPAKAQTAPSPDVFISVPGGGTYQTVVRGGSPAAVLEAYRNQRSELRNQLERLENQRENISDQLQRGEGQAPLSDADKKGLEQRLGTIDARIADVEKQITVADANVAQAAAVPGSVVPPPPRPPRDGPPEEFFVLGGIFMFVVLLPLSIAYARRIWRKSVGTVSALPQEIYDRFNRLDQAVDAVAIEVERVGEGQRYLTRVHAEQQRALGAGAAAPVEIGERERERQARK